MKKKYLIIGIVIILLIFILFFSGMPIGVECGYVGFLGTPQKNCECIGIKTGGCMPFATCDGASYSCIGICQNCVCRQLNATGQWEEVSCD